MISDELINRLSLIGILAVLILGTSCAPAGPVIRVESASASVQVNDETRVAVTVENIAGLTAFEIHLSFDSRALEVVKLNDGEFIKADFIVQNTFDNVAGTIDYAVAQINHPPANGSGTLFELVFRGKTHGNSPIRFRATQAAPAGALFSDSKGIAIPVSLRDGSVNVSESVNRLPVVQRPLLVNIFFAQH